MSKRFLKHYRVAVALLKNDSRFASFGTRTERIKAAYALVKMAVDAQSLKAIGPMLAQQFVAGSGGEYSKEDVRKNPERYAVQTLMGSMNLNRMQAAANLKQIEKAVETSLEKSYNSYVNSFGVDALEESYTKMVLDMVIYSASWERGITTLEKAKTDAANLVAATMRNDMIDAIRVQKNRYRLERDMGLDMQAPEEIEAFDGDTILSARPSEKMREAILTLIDSPEATREIVKHSQSALRIRGADGARSFVSAARSCSVFATTSKYSIGTRNDLLALALVIPYTKKFLKGSSRYESIKKTIEYMKRDMSGPDEVVTGEVVRKMLNESRVRSQDPDGTAKAFNSIATESLANLMERYIETAYAELLKVLVKMTAGVETGLVGDCIDNLSKLSDKVELEKLRQKLEVPRSVNWDR